jgi:RND family efflux transporter MFP subunit
MLTAAALTGCVETAESKQEEPIRPVRAEAVRYEPAVQPLVLAGTITPRQETSLAFRVAGKIIARPVDVGTRVHPGTVIAQLDGEDYRLQLRAVQWQIEAAEADLTKARADLARYEGIKSSPAFNAATYDQRRMAADTAGARLAQLRNQMKLAGNQVDYAVLRADDDGVVTAVSAQPGQTVAAGQVVVQVARLGEKEITVAVPEQRVAQITAGGAMEVSVWALPDQRYRATLRELSPFADPAVRTYAARFTIPDADDAVRLGMTASLRVAPAANTPVAALPLTAVFQQGQAPALWVVDPATGRLALKPVEVAAYRADAVLIAAGVDEGDMVVTAGVHKLDATQRVRLLGAPRP